MKHLTNAGISCVVLRGVVAVVHFSPHIARLDILQIKVAVSTIIFAREVGWNGIHPVGRCM